VDLRVPDARYIAAVPVGAVAVFAGIVSYSHIYWLAVATGQAGTAARLMPFSVDALIVAGSVILFQASARQQWLGWLGVGPGVAATVFANVESGISHGWLAAIVAGWPALAFSLASFMLERWFAGQAKPALASTAACGHAPAQNAEDAVVTAYLHARDCTGDPVSQRRLADAFGISRPRVAELVRPYLTQAEAEAA
jgi:hypothetical protein